MGVPLLFTEAAGTAELTLVPAPGLYLSDDLFLSDDLYLDDGPTLDFYAVTPAIPVGGVVVTVDPVPATFTMAVPDGLQDQTTLIVDPVPANFVMPVPATTTPNVVIVQTEPVPVTFFMDVPPTSGGQFLILVPSVRELAPLRLTHLVETPTGRVFRWAEDEPNPANVPNSVRFSDTMPGGYESADATLPRNPERDYSDLERLSNWRVEGAGGELVWEGRIERAPRSAGFEMSVSPAGVGHQAHLDDDKTAAANYVDRDLTKWTEPGATRQFALSGSNTLGSVSTQPDPNGNPTLILSFTGPWASTGGARAEAYYEAPMGDRVQGMYATYLGNGNVVNTFDEYLLTVLSTDDQVTFPEFATDHLPFGGPTSGTMSFTPASAKRQMCVLFAFTAPGGADGQEFQLYLQNLAVFGATGIPLVGPDPHGVLASDVVKHAVGRWAPLLNTTPESVQASGFIIPHLTFPEPTTASEIVRQAARFGLQDWAVWGDRTFWFHPRGAKGRTWRARVSPARLEETGPQIDRLFESVVVQYTDVDGSQRAAGPPGSGATVESASLKDLDTDNPAVQAGVVRRALLTMGTSTSAAAVEIGRRFLEEQKLLDTSGRATLVGHVEDDRGVLWPYWKVRAGDNISFVDASDPSPRRIVRTDKDHSSRTCSVDLDAPPEGLQALLERLGVVLTPLGIN